MNDLLLKAIRGDEVDRPPVWFMRQAGRFLSSYRAIREKFRSIMEMIEDEEIIVKVTKLPVDELGVDAAILFSDIMLPLRYMGINFDIEPGIGPVIKDFVVFPGCQDEIGRLDISGLDFLRRAINTLIRELSVPLIGFAGAPFTIASYIVEGKPSKDFVKVKTFMNTYPQDWKALMEKLSNGIMDYLGIQIDAGIKVIQIFDSWIHSLSYEDYEEYVFPYVLSLINRLRKKYDELYIIYFGTGIGNFLELVRNLPVDVVGLDWRVDIKRAYDILNADAIKTIGVQGNLDPATLLCPWEIVSSRAYRILEKMAGITTFIFNLGHGVMPATNEKIVKQLVDFIKQASSFIHG